MFLNFKIKEIVGLVGWIAVCIIASSSGILTPPDEWYSELNKPLWNPPNFIFGPVWATLYFMMAVSAWLIWKRGGWNQQRSPLIIFLTQLVLNSLWSPLFFGMHEPGWALFNIILLLISIIATIIKFLCESKTAALFLIPYLVWVIFASILNYNLWKMNT